MRKAQIKLMAALQKYPLDSGSLQSLRRGVRNMSDKEVADAIGRLNEWVSVSAGNGEVSTAVDEVTANRRSRKVAGLKQKYLSRNMQPIVPTREPREEEPAMEHERIAAYGG